MANTTNTFTPGSTIQQFSGLVLNSNNIYPRARVIFDSAETITAKGAGDTRTLFTEFSLPVNFAYIIDQLTLAVNVNDSNNYDNNGLLTVNNDQVGSDNAVLPLLSEGFAYADNQATEIKVYRLINPFGEIIYNQDGGAPLVEAKLFDDDGTNATGAGSLNLYVSFLQYDIQQVQNVAVNAPMPVRSR